MSQNERSRRLRAMRKAQGLCYNCGEPTGGKTRCEWCLKKMALAQKERERKKLELLGDDYRQAKREYMKKWLAENPDKVAVYKSRKSEYNRRYAGYEDI